MESSFPSKNMKPIGKSPSIILANPKFPHNVGAALRAASCFDVKQVFFTGDRVTLDPKKGRLPREERMKGYADVDLYQYDRPFDCFDHVTPVCVEIKPDAELLPFFEHPENAVYVFGPEDGSVPSVLQQHCHRFVVIPTAHCTNLAAAVYVTLYDRRMKRQLAGLEPIKSAAEILNETRGYIETDFESL